MAVPGRTGADAGRQPAARPQPLPDQRELALASATTSTCRGSPSGSRCASSTGACPRTWAWSSWARVSTRASRSHGCRSPITSGRPAAPRAAAPARRCRPWREPSRREDDNGAMRFARGRRRHRRPRRRRAPRARSRSAVRLLDGPFNDAMVRDQASLLALDPDRLLHTFRLTAGLPTTATPLWRLGGARCRATRPHRRPLPVGLRADVCGHRRPRFKQRGDALVAELATIQIGARGEGIQPRYLSAFPEELIDRVEARRRVWAPYYTLHKMHGRAAGHAPALRQPSRRSTSC